MNLQQDRPEAVAQMPTMLDDLAGKVALVTGTAEGLAIAVALAVPLCQDRWSQTQLGYSGNHIALRTVCSTDSWPSGRPACRCTSPMTATATRAATVRSSV